MSKSIVYEADFDENKYWERVNRNLGWLGDSNAEQVERQTRIKNTTVGVAGTGGIGGATAERLARMGVTHLKVADPEFFDLSNINRQFGASFKTVGKNKADTVAQIIHDSIPDVKIEVYTDGITDETADEFFEGCDYVLDKIELYNIPARYALHRAFRRSKTCRYMLLTPVFGHRAFVFKWTRESMPVEEYFDVPDEHDLSPAMLERLIERFVPEMPQYPSAAMRREWFIDMKRCPIFAGCPPLAQGLLAERLGLAITGLDELPGAVALPVTPGYAMFDAMTWEAKMVHGKWW